MNYFFIADKELVGRQTSMFRTDLYFPDVGWAFDKERILMDRLIGYEQGEGIGNTDMLLQAEKISERVANLLIEALYK